MNSVQASKLAEPAEHTRDLIDLIQEFVFELHPQRNHAAPIKLQDTLDRDLGIDSLGRAELFLRIEREFKIRLPQGTLSQAQIVGDLVSAVQQAAPRARTRKAAAAPPAALPLVAAATDAQTLTQVLDWHVAQHPDRRFATVLEDEDTVLATMTFAQLADGARRLAAGLILRDTAPGDRIALMLPTGTDFLLAFFGALYAGAVPVPIYPPARLTQIEEHMQRQAGILRNAGARVLITVPEAQPLIALIRGQVETLTTIETVATLSVQAPTTLAELTDGSATGFLQYTSGSTGDPKGVVLSHANLLANVRALGTAIDASSADIFVSWLPLYHDFGLIGAVLGSLYYAASLYLMSPLSFLAKPESWLRAIDRYRATLSAAPNFAFELCLGKIELADIAGVDLSSLRLVANGAEPVSAQTVRQFIARFQPYGLKPQAMLPAYGLAECAVGLTLSPLGRPPLIDRVNREALSRRGVAEQASSDDAAALEIVSCGRPLPGHAVRVVDDSGQEIGERREGRLEFRGPSATSGYFRNPTKTHELFHGEWLDSGDQAYMAAGEVYVTGRIKDIIIRAGRHIYPHEIEKAVAEIPGVIRNGVAAFGSSDRRSGTERVVVLVETTSVDPRDRSALQARANNVVTSMIGAPPDEVVLVPPATVPKTSSGKVRRGAARDLYESGQAGRPQRSIRWQMARLSIGDLRARLAHLPRSIAAFGYAIWWWGVLAFMALPASCVVLLLPKLVWRWAVLRRLARATLAAVGTPLKLTGADHLAAGKALIVFNHSSYADVLAIAAVVPDAPVFIAKKEFAAQFFVGTFLRRLGVIFVERFDVASSLADAAAITEVARKGRLLVFFPEGTFTRRIGLAEFHLGAFKVAADTGLPVIPGVIRGTRAMLRDGQWLPRWSPISVFIDAPVAPTSNEFSAVVALRDKVRNVMLRQCGEPDLGGLSVPELSPAAHHNG